MPNGNFINTDIFDLLEFNMLELSFEITLFDSFYYQPVQVEMFTDCGNCQFRSQFEGCPFKRRRNSGLGMRNKCNFLQGRLTALRTINPVNVKLKKSCFGSIWQALNPASPDGIGSLCGIKTPWTAKLFAAQLLKHNSPSKNHTIDVEIQ